MANFNDTEASRFAAEIVKAAVSSESIKLLGPRSDEPTNKTTAQRDAVYLATLINDLANAIKS